MNARAQRLPVSDALRPWVKRIDVAAYGRDGDGCPLIHVPDPATVLVWRTRPDGSGDVLVAGPRTHASYHDAKDIPVCARFRIGLGAAPTLLGVSAREVVDRVVPLGELWGRSAERLADDLARLEHEPARAVRRIEAALLSHVQRERAPERARAQLVRDATAALATSPGRPPARVGEVARRVGVSERQLRNVFTANVGMPPKQFARLSRVRTLLPRARRESWAQLAGDVGYYDQSHMSAEFRALMHITPGAFAAGRFPTVAC